VAATIEEFGAVDVLVNNAATNPYAGPMIDVDLGRWDKTFQVNVTAPLVWTQLCWNLWMKEHGGSVINVSSVGALGTSPALGVYATTKAALIHMTEELAAELSPQVRVNALAPGLVKTDFARVLWDGGRGDEVAQAYPLKRLGEVDDIAGAALYLASDMSSFMTGRTLVLDGGGLIGHRTIA
ncbi:MAG: SDR family oxidoreductase, partial [Acidimicrobiales bacterium]